MEGNIKLLVLGKESIASDNTNTSPIYIHNIIMYCATMECKPHSHSEDFIVIFSRKDGFVTKQGKFAER